MAEFRKGRIELGGGEPIADEAKPGFKAGAPQVDEFNREEAALREQEKQRRRREIEQKIDGHRREKQKLRKMFEEKKASEQEFNNRVAELDSEIYRLERELNELR